MNLRDLRRSGHAQPVVSQLRSDALRWLRSIERQWSRGPKQSANRPGPVGRDQRIDQSPEFLEADDCRAQDLKNIVGTLGLNPLSEHWRGLGHDWSGPGPRPVRAALHGQLLAHERGS